MDEIVLYHGTRRGFMRGGLLMPVRFHRSEQRSGHVGIDSTDYAYVTTERDLAVSYAMQSKGRAAPRLLICRPINEIEVDPSTYEGERHVQYRSRGGFIVERVEILTAYEQAEWHAAVT